MKCETKGSSIHVRVPAEEKQLISDLAARAGVNPSEYVRMTLRSTLSLIRATAGAV